MRLNNNQQAFLALVRAGLWEKDVQIAPFGTIAFSMVQRIAEEQSVIGLVAAGLEHIVDMKVPKKEVLSFIGQTLQLELRNQKMNQYIRSLIDQMRRADIYVLLVKGQGVAQCYERPLWRSCGDIDLLLSDYNYEKAKKMLMPLADGVETEYTGFKHQGMTLNSWSVELHGTLHTRLSKRIDSELDKVQEEVFGFGKIRAWQNEDIDIFLPAPDEDVIFLFTHILHHFYIEGIGLRQICDLCRLLWCYRTTIDQSLLESRLKRMGLMSEWKSFASFSVDYLGMPVEATPLYSPEQKWARKAEKILEFVLESGNFGHNRQNSGGGKLGSAWRKMRDFVNHTRVFPIDSGKFLFHFVGNGIHVARDMKRKNEYT